MNWDKRYAADKKPRTWKNVQNSTPVPAQPVTNSPSGRTWKTVQPIKDAPKPEVDWNSWSSIQLPQNDKKAKGFVGTGESTYTRLQNGQWHKKLSDAKVKEYAVTRPGMYKTPGQTFENTVFIHPMHEKALSRMINDRMPIAHSSSNGVEFHAQGSLPGIPDSHVVNRSFSGGDYGVYKIPANHISNEPFQGATPFQWGKITYDNGDTNTSQHMGHPVAEVNYE